MPRAIIFVNGDLPDPNAARTMIQPEDVLIAADGGARHAQQLGLTPNIIIGDLDSLSTDEVNAFAKMGTHILRYPAHKDETDLELALDHALKAGYSPIILVAGLGGRLDHMLGNIALLSDPACLAANVRLDDGLTEVFFLTSQASLRGTPGEIVSLLPWGAPAEGVHTEGLSYPLRSETLLPYRTRGVSNEMLSDTAIVSVKRGTLLCVHHHKNPSSR
jgi:thiamine pyrophosphokinase